MRPPPPAPAGQQYVNHDTGHDYTCLAGQQYVNHHDTSNTYHKWPQGHRVFTLFLYLSDVEKGGNRARVREETGLGFGRKQG